MQWLPEEPVKYANWEDSSSPSDLVPMDTCVAMHSNTGKWENVSCLDEVENGVICETSQSKIRSHFLAHNKMLFFLIRLIGWIEC